MVLADFTALLKRELEGQFQENELRNHIMILYEFYLGLDRAQTVMNANMQIDEESSMKLLSALADLKSHKPCLLYTSPSPRDA